MLAPAFHQKIPAHVRPDEQSFPAIAICLESFLQTFRPQLVGVHRADERLDDANQSPFAAVRRAVHNQKPLRQVVAEQRQPRPPLQQIGIVRLDGGQNQFVQEARTIRVRLKIKRRTVARIIFRREPAELDVAIVGKPNHAVGDVDEALLHLERAAPLDNALERRHHRVQPRLRDLDFQRELLRLPADFQNAAGNHFADAFGRDGFPQAGFRRVAVEMFFRPGRTARGFRARKARPNTVR